LNHNNYRSWLAGRITIQYILTIIGVLIVYILFIFLAISIYYSISWQAYSPVYQLAHFIKEYFLIFFFLPILIAWIVITFLYLFKTLHYLDEVVMAAEQLTTQSKEPIILSSSLKAVQDKLNLIREQSNQNAMIAKEAEQRKNDLLVYLAHDLKTPLASVIGYLNLLHDESQISQELREKYLSISLKKAERLEELINEFFEIARFHLSNIILQYSKINITRLLEQLIYEFQPMLKEKNLNCNLYISNDIMLKCDADKIQRVFDNLLHNAVIYSFEDSDIDITATLSEKYLTIEFLNDGNTIPKEKLDRIFEQFYRLDASRNTQSGGAGLGLAIAREIVELHNGTISAKSENNKIQFKVTLPIL